MKIRVKASGWRAHDKVHLTVGATTLALTRGAAMQLAIKLADAAQHASEPSWQQILDELEEWQRKLFK